MPRYAYNLYEIPIVDGKIKDPVIIKLNIRKRKQAEKDLFKALHRLGRVTITKVEII